MFVCCSPFPQVAEAVQEELESYRSQEEEVKRLKSAMVGRSPYVLLSQSVHNKACSSKAVGFPCI